MDNEDLGRYQGMLPSRAVLARLSLFGVDEETRDSANAILKALPPMNERERREYYDETWKLASLSESDMMLSPSGRATLEMLKNSKPVGDDVVKADAISTLESPATAQAVTSATMPEPEPDDVNPYLRKLDWPPRSTQPQPKAPEDVEVKHRWVAGTPQQPSKDLRPIAESDFGNNEPLY